MRGHVEEDQVLLGERVQDGLEVVGGYWVLWVA